MKKTMTKSMIRAFSLVLALVITVGIVPIFATSVDAAVPSCSGLYIERAFPDKEFREYVWVEVLRNNGEIPDKYTLSFADSFDVATMTNVDVSGLGIESLEGIEYFCALIALDCSDNKISELDLGMNTFLKKLDASENALTSLDLSRNALLMSADLSEQSVEVFLGMNVDLYEIAGRRDLYNIKADGVSVGKAYDSKTGELTLEKLPEKNVSYSAPVNNKNFKLEVTLVQKKLEGQKLSKVFPDEKFAAYVYTTVLGNKGSVKLDYVITAADAKKIKEDTKIIEVEGKEIKSLEGIEFFANLEKLHAKNNNIEKINLLANVKLEEVDLSGNKKLEKLAVKTLEHLYELNVANTAISTLTLNKLEKLEVLNVSGTAFKTLDVTANKKLTKLYCAGLGLTTLNVSKNYDLTLLDCSNNALTSLYLNRNTKLQELNCSYNSLVGLDLAKCNVKTFNGNGQTREITLSGASVNLTKLAGNKVYNVKVNGKDAGKLYDSKTGVLTFGAPVWTVSYEASVNAGKFVLPVKLNVKDELSGKEIGDLFPDDDFAEYVWTKILGHTASSYDDDNELTVREIYTIEAVETLDVSDCGISSLAGIKYFKSLKVLDCSDNNLKTLDLSDNKYLTKVDCGGNKLTSIDVTENDELETLICDDNKLTSINVIYNDELVTLDVSDNELTSLNVTKNVKLKKLDCSHNKLTSLNVTKNEKLRELDCSYNSLAYVDLSGTSISSKSKVNCNDQTVYVEMAYSIDLEKLTGVDADDITVVSVNGKKKGYDVEDGVVTSDSWIKTLEYEVEVSWGKTSSKRKDMSVTVENVYSTEGYIITYEPGTYGVGDVKYAYKAKNKSVELEDAIFTRTGYVQIGWATKNGGAKVYDLGEKYSENKSVTLYPVWGEDTYTVKFDANGGKLGSTSKTVSYGEKYGKLPTPSREGYEFAGWFTKKTGGEQITAGTKVTTRANHTLYAHWTKSTSVTKYTVEFVTNGGTKLSMLEASKGTVIDLNECVTTRKGYNFEGWYLDSALTEKVTKITLVCDVKVYAKWSATSLTGSMSNFKLSGTYGGYSDVDETKWYGIYNQGVIRDVTRLGIMVGDGANFRPDSNITIAEVIKMAAVVHNTYYGGQYNFDQSNGTYWFDTYVEYAINNNIIKSGEFANYTKSATRAEMAHIFAKSLPEKEFSEISSLRPADVDLKDKYVDEIKMLYAAGVITGTNANGDFVGERTITRAEAAAIIVRVALTNKRISK